MTLASSAVPAARLRGLTKRYGDQLAVDGIDLELAAGELRGLLGPNGAGKTTLLRILFGLVAADSGSVEILGRPHAATRRPPLNGVAGFVEDPRFYAYLSGRANLELLIELDDDPSADVDEALERVGLSDRAAERVGSYSTGMRQRLGIAAALLRRPRLLLLDEPTSGLDPAGNRAVGALLRELSDQGVAVLLSSHLIGELELLCHSYTIVRAGRVVWDGPRARLETEAPGSVYRLQTSDDDVALTLARHSDGLSASPADGVAGLRLAVTPGTLDGYIRAVVEAGLAVRGLELLVSPLESMYFSLASDDIATVAPEPGIHVNGGAPVRP
ncbi:MAG TPA: ATP-binding cassette domain-containing protein [Solirubrobacteraceae bacterium]